jgi:hypothetical protein
MNFKDWVGEVSGVKKKFLHVYVKGVYSFVDASAADVPALLETLNKQEIDGRMVRAEITARPADQGERKFKGKSRGNYGQEREGGWKKQAWSGGNKSSGSGNFSGKRDFNQTGFKKKKY